MLAAGALVASVLAAGASPAAAQANEPDHRPEVTPHWSACVGAAGAHDAGFSDVGANDTHADDINCIAYYGITLGMGDGTYAPGDHVTAFQMELFVQRTADLMGADGEAVLADVDLSDTVTRLEMAQLMFGLLDDMLGWVRINSSGAIEFDRDDDGSWVEANDYFADARAEVPIAASNLIGAAYELGVTRGRSANVSTDDSVFAPSDPVTRGQMASFITRTLDHSNLRPEGLAAQRNNGVGLDRPETQVSYRDADFWPIEDARIDAFSSIYPEDAFDDDGECEARFVRDESESDDACEISLVDAITDDDGNAIFTLNSDVAPVAVKCMTQAGDTPASHTATLKFTSAGGPTERTNWVWTGDLGDRVDDDTELAEVEDVDRPVAGAGPDHAHITGGQPTGRELAKMGETVTFTVQIRTGEDDPQPTGPDRSRNPYRLTITHYFVGASNDGTHTAEAAQTGQTWTISEELPGNWDFLEANPAGGASADVRDAVDTAQAFQTSFDSVAYPNSDGRFTIALANMDLHAANNNDDVLVRFTLMPIPGNDLIGENLLSSITAKANHATGNSATNPQASGYALFSDDPATATSVSGASASSYRIVNSDGTGNSVTVTVTDQYGDPLRNIGITVDSDLDVEAAADDEARYPEAVDDTVEDDENGTDAESSLITRRNGTYRIGYSYVGTSAQTEMITPSVVQVLGDNPATAETVETDFELQAAIPGSAVNVYFARVGSSSASQSDEDTDPEPLPIRVTDVSRRAIVVNEPLLEADADTDNPMVYYYDEEDTFVVHGTPATLEMFEEALEATFDDDEIYPSMLLWESYDFYQPRDRAIFELTMACTDPSAG